MDNKRELSRITIDLPTVDHKRLKAVAAILGKSMRDIVIDAIEEYLRKVKTMNKATRQAITAVEAGEDLAQAEDVQDLFEKLGI